MSDWPRVCFLVEDINGKLLDNSYRWGEIPPEGAKQFFGLPDQVIEELKKRSIEVFQICWAIIFDGEMSVERKEMVR